MPPKQREPPVASVRPPNVRLRASTSETLPTPLLQDRSFRRKKWPRGYEWLLFLGQLILEMAAFKNCDRQVRVDSSRSVQMQSHFTGMPG